MVGFKREMTACNVGAIVAACALWNTTVDPLLADPLDDYFALEDRMAEAQALHLEATHSHDPAGGAATPKARNSKPGPRLGILRKMDALSDAPLDAAEGAPIAAGTFFWSWNLDLDLGGLHGRFERLVRRFPDHTAMGDVLVAVPPAALATGSADTWVKTLERLTASSKREETKLGALFAVAHIHMGAKNLSQAKAVFEKIRKAGPTSTSGEQAKGFIHEIEHLQVGMIAPDFVTKTVDGKDLALKSFRGKAVLLNFWASW